jgi:hypothetical protein
MLRKVTLIKNKICNIKNIFNKHRKQHMHYKCIRFYWQSFLEKKKILLAKRKESKSVYAFHIISFPRLVQHQEVLKPRTLK